MAALGGSAVGWLVGWTGVAESGFRGLNDTRKGSVRIAAIRIGSFGYSHRGAIFAQWFQVRGLQAHLV